MASTPPTYPIGRSPSPKLRRQVLAKTRYLRDRFGNPAMHDIDRDVKPRAAVRHIIAFEGTKRSIVAGGESQTKNNASSVLQIAIIVRTIQFWKPSSVSNVTFFQWIRWCCRTVVGVRSTNSSTPMSHA